MLKLLKRIFTRPIRLDIFEKEVFAELNEHSLMHYISLPKDTSMAMLSVEWELNDTMEKFIAKARARVSDWATANLSLQIFDVTFNEVPVGYHDVEIAYVVHISYASKGYNENHTTNGMYLQDEFGKKYFAGDSHE